jgi:hypothetical protein
MFFLFFWNVIDVLFIYKIYMWIKIMIYYYCIVFYNEMNE